MTFTDRLKNSIRTYKRIDGMNYYLLEDDNEKLDIGDLCKLKEASNIVGLTGNDIRNYPTIGKIKLAYPISQVFRQLPRNYFEVQ